jgi:hypothetical protein
VRDVEMAPKGFLRLAADKADEVVLVDRTTDRDGRLRFGWLGLLSTEGAERPGDRADQIAQVGDGDVAPGDVSDDDLRRERGDRPWFLLLCMFGMLRH